VGSEARKALRDHPTVKPVAMLEDALHDLTKRNDIVLDPFPRIRLDAHRCREDRAALLGR
jgi:hypothetical protein